MAHTDGPNAEMRRHWSETAGPRWVRDRERYDAGLAPFLGPLLAAAGAQPGDRVLDAGCGFGTTTLALAAQVGPTGEVVGADISATMLAELERRADESRDSDGSIHVLHADLQTDPLPGPFDLVVSRFGIMFFDDPVAAWRNMRDAMRAAGRLAFVCWQAPVDNPWSYVPARAALAVSPSDVTPPGPTDPGANSLADPSRIQLVLSSGGWTKIDVQPLTPDMTIGRSLDEAVDRSREGNQAVAAAIGRIGEAAVLPAVRSALEPYVADDGAVRLASAAWLVTAIAPDSSPGDHEDFALS